MSSRQRQPSVTTSAATYISNRCRRRARNNSAVSPPVCSRAVSSNNLTGNAVTTYNPVVSPPGSSIAVSSHNLTGKVSTTNNNILSDSTVSDSSKEPAAPTPIVPRKWVSISVLKNSQPESARAREQWATWRRKNLLSKNHQQSSLELVHVDGGPVIRARDKKIDLGTGLKTMDLRQRSNRWLDERSYTLEVNEGQPEDHVEYRGQGPLLLWGGLTFPREAPGGRAFCLHDECEGLEE